MAPADAARALGFRDTKDRTAEERLLQYEKGAEVPSHSLLVKMSEKYRRSLLVFYLKQRPAKADRGTDFRTAVGSPSPTFDPTLDALIRDILVRQDLVRSLLEDNESPRLAFVGSARNTVNRDVIVRSIIETIGFQLDEFRKARNVDAAFAYLRQKIGSIGVFVVLAGNLGTHHSNISSDVFRGYAIADEVAPFIIINDQDAKSAWSFTALHELAHIWIGATGVSGEVLSADGIERLCDRVAAQILVPENEELAVPITSGMSVAEAASLISAYAKAWKVSHSMVAFQFMARGFISQTLWSELSAMFRAEWMRSKEKKPTVEEAEGKPSYYVVRRHRIGPALLGIVHRSLQEGAISQTKAGKVLGVKPRSVAPLLSNEGIA